MYNCAFRELTQRDVVAYLNEILHAVLRKSSSGTREMNMRNQSTRKQNERLLIPSALEQKEQQRNFSCRAQSMRLTCKAFTFVTYTRTLYKAPQFCLTKDSSM